MENNECPICLYILIKPVTLPCSHEFCYSCLQVNTDSGNLKCPLCRLRISNWLRRIKNTSETIVNRTRWKEIKAKFPKQIKARLKNSDHIKIPRGPPLVLSKPGEIRQEYEREVERVQQEIARERQVEEEASLKAIQELLQEEQRLKEKQAELELIAACDEKFIQIMGMLSEEMQNCDSSILEIIYEQIKLNLESKSGNGRKQMQSCTTENAGDEESSPCSSSVSSWNALRDLVDDILENLEISEGISRSEETKGTLHLKRKKTSVTEFLRCKKQKTVANKVDRTPGSGNEYYLRERS